MDKLNNFTIISVLVLLLSFTSSIAAENESVLDVGMEVCATNNLNKYPAICVKANSYLEREVTLSGEVDLVEMEERKSRWYGKLGILNKEPAYWESSDLMLRSTIEESELNFDNIEDFRSWHEKYHDMSREVYNDEGLFMSWGVEKDSNGENGVLNLLIFQILIGGTLPDSLPGSVNSSIIVNRCAGTLLH